MVVVVVVVVVVVIVKERIANFVLVERFLSINSDPSETPFVLFRLLSTLVNKVSVDLFICKLRVGFCHNRTNIHVSVFVVAPISMQIINLCVTN